MATIEKYTVQKTVRLSPEQEKYVMQQKGDDFSGKLRTVINTCRLMEME